VTLPDGPLVVLFSGGRDSTCLLDLCAARGGDVRALHVDYGLRDAESDADAAHCRAVCAELGIELEVVRAGAPAGNVQAWARDVRYAAAEGLAERHGALIAVGHTATDQVETVLLRLASSPGRRALLGMAAREGRIVRPLLGWTREETAAHCAARGLPWREDSANADSARGRLREVVLPALRALHPAAEANILRTLEVLRDEAQVLDAAVDEGLSAASRPSAPSGASAHVRGQDARRTTLAAPSRPSVSPEPVGVDLAGLPPALARLVLQRLADEAAGGTAPALGLHADAVLALRREGTASLDLPGGLRAVSAYGRVTIARRAQVPAPAPARLSVPGRVAYGDGELVCECGPGLPVADGTLAARALAPELVVRPWRPGDRMRPLGLDGSKSLQDLFTDRKVPRAQRARLPVVVSAGEIAWVPGVATGEAFRVHDADRERVRLRWCLDSGLP
jgi:tRNA(Ile)-lysidine synthase